jgi:hypothetical protein
MAHLEQWDVKTAFLVVGGVLLIWFSFLYVYFDFSRPRWNNDLAGKLQQASANYHDLFHARLHAPSRRGTKSSLTQDAGPEIDDSAQQAVDEYSNLSTRLRAAQAGNVWAVYVARTGGLLLIALGLFRRWWHTHANTT